MAGGRVGVAPVQVISLLVAIIVFAGVSAAWFYSVPLSWIYATGDALALSGDENTLNLLLISGWLVAAIPALITLICSYRHLR